MNELEHYEDNLNSNILNSLALKRFVEVAKKVRANLNDKHYEFTRSEEIR